MNKILLIVIVAIWVVIGVLAFFMIRAKKKGTGGSASKPKNARPKVKNNKRNKRGQKEEVEKEQGFNDAEEIILKHQQQNEADLQNSQAVTIEEQFMKMTQAANTQQTQQVQPQQPQLVQPVQQVQQQPTQQTDILAGFNVGSGILQSEVEPTIVAQNLLHELTKAISQNNITLAVALCSDPYVRVVTNSIFVAQQEALTRNLQIKSISDTKLVKYYPIDTDEIFSVSMTVIFTDYIIKGNQRVSSPEKEYTRDVKVLLKRKIKNPTVWTITNCNI